MCSPSITMSICLFVYTLRRLGVRCLDDNATTARRVDNPTTHALRGDNARRALTT
jgi:hypothetical protein